MGAHNGSAHMRTQKLLFLPLAVLALVGLSSCSAGKDTSVKVYELGTRVEAGHLIYTVYETQWLPQLGTGDAARVPKGRFFLIRLAAVNSGSEEALVPNLTIQDDQGNTLEELDNGEGVPQWLGYLRKVAPADSISGNIVFDAEPKHYRLRVTDENGEKPAIVDIPLSFNAETPQTPLPNSALPAGGAAGLQSPAKK
jgi:hypothetical protein